jgi:hypothetical protein
MKAMPKNCQCGWPLDYNERFDCYYCSKCNEWKEKACSDEKCFYCKDRPERPRKIDDDPAKGHE